MTEIDFADMLRRNDELVRQFNADVDRVTKKHADALKQYLPSFEEHKSNPIIEPYFEELYDLLHKYNLFT